jgi:hypothetical protein
MTSGGEKGASIVLLRERFGGADPDIGRDVDGELGEASCSAWFCKNA